MRKRVRGAAEIRWTGAVETARSVRSGWTVSEASCRVGALGAQTVRCSVDGGSSTFLLRGVDVALDQVRVSAFQLTADRVEIDPALPVNEQTMGYFFRADSIAVLEETAPGVYLTSIDRRVVPVVEVWPPVFAPIVEWRVDGEPVSLGLRKPFALTEAHGVGSHRVSTGPFRDEQSTELVVYRTVVERPLPGEIMVDGEDVLCVARTEPAGYEDRITWLSSTKYGAASPILGRGPTFSVRFMNTWGPAPDVGSLQWIGVRADNALINQDLKCTFDCGFGPVCDNCQVVNDTFLECAHFTPADDEPCSTTQCIRNTLSSASCTRNETELGAAQCDTAQAFVGFMIVQELITDSCTTTDPGGYHLWTTLYRGCNNACVPESWFVRCDAPACAGPVVDTAGRGVLTVCGC